MQRFTTRFLLTCAAIGIAGAVLLLPLFLVFSAAAVAAAPLVYAATVGVWFLPGALAQALTHRAGSAALTTLVAGLVCVPFTPYGWTVIATTLTIGIAQEIPHAVTLYRVWSPWLSYASAVVIGGIYALMLWSAYGAGVLPEWMLFAMVPIVALSALAFTWLGQFLAERVARTGVARGLRPAPRASSVDAAAADAR